MIVPVGSLGPASTMTYLFSAIYVGNDGTERDFGKTIQDQFVAAPQGFEPRYAAPEAAVLPLNEGATRA